MDDATNTTTATATSRRLAAEEEALTATLADQLIEGERLVCSKYNEIVMKHGKGLCHKHGNHKRCDFQAVRTLPKRRAFASSMARPYMAMTGKNAQHLDVVLML